MIDCASDPVYADAAPSDASSASAFSIPGWRSNSPACKSMLPGA
jgi:hypothetical protein